MGDKKCKYHHICGLDVARSLMDEYRAEDSCILHSQNPRKLQDNKYYEEFTKTLEEHRKEKGDDFRHMVFPGDANFSLGFTKVAYFGGVRFTKAAHFNGATFAQGADFSGATFTEVADFNVTTFSERACFCKAKFSGEVDFGQARFTKGADFGRVTFTKGVSFTGADFSEGANFEWVTFDKGGEVSFAWTRFSKGVNFMRATFNEGSDFSGTTFGSNGAVFSLAKFLGEMFFAGDQQADGEIVPIFSEVEVHFTEVAILPPGKITFRRASLEKCRFLGTDLRTVRTVWVQWPEIVDPMVRRLAEWPLIGPRIKKWRIGRRVGVYDEIHALEGKEKEGTHPPWPEIEQLYRQLKQNYEDQRDYERAGDFHYGEKEMRRKNPETSWGLWLLLIFYRLVSGYGERVLKPILWALGLSVVCAVVYLCDLSLKEATSGNLTSGKSPTWGEVAIYSFQVTAFFKPQDFVLSVWAKVIYTLQSLLGPLLLGLFALAVRQKLKR